MVPGKSDLTNYKLAELQQWRGDMVCEMKELRQKIETLDRKNDKGFADINLKLGGINDFMIEYRKKDAPRIDRLEKGVIGTIILFAMALAGIVWEVVWGKTIKGV